MFWPLVRPSFEVSILCSFYMGVEGGGLIETRVIKNRSLPRWGGGGGGG